MDWLRRNWPDLAIGLALVAVIAGIVATLITGGSFFPVAPATPAGAPSTPPPAVTAPVPEQPAAVPVDVPPPSQGSVSVLTPEGEVAEPAAPAPAAAPSAPAAATPTPATPPAAAPAAVVEPLSPPPATPPAPAAAPTPAPAAAAAPATPAPAAPRPAGALPAASGDEAAPYRVSVGAFGNADNAARQAAAFRTAGYPVFTGTQGNLTIVLVGPYDTEAAADAVAARIATSGFGVDPVVYRFRPDAATPGASTPTPAAAPASTPAPAAPVAPTPAPPVVATPPTPPPAIQTAPTGRSLQVGAFADAGSAAPLRERLASLGLVAFETREDGLIKLLVGPFETARLTEVRQQLAAQGIESFPR